LAIKILRDQKPIFTFPWRAVRGEHWKSVLGVAIGTAGLIALDPTIERYFHDRPAFRSYQTGPLRGRNTALVTTLTPVAFYVVGLAKHSTKTKNTGLLAAEALVDTQLLSFVTKQAVGRVTPSDIPPHGNLRDTWFKYQGPFLNRGSFPSGHTASAFGVATVISERYRQRRWIPLVAYGAATVFSLSRLPTRAHFPSDIFIGAALGYSISHFVVLGR
jgi:membrane-associated phospholipid phosphatase